MTDTPQRTDLVESVARALKPAAFRIYDEGYPAASNIIRVTAFLNAEKNVKRARKDAEIAVKVCIKNGNSCNAKRVAREVAHAE
jgi:hypothetical protein